MSFQAYLDNIQAKTGKSPADFRRLATDKGFAVGGKLKPGVKRVPWWRGSRQILRWGMVMRWGSPRGPP
jgi:hypothetical protein